VRRRRVQLAVAVTVVGLLGVVAAAAVAGGGHGNIREFLTGYQEDPAAISTTGFGDFKAKVRDGKIEYRLSYGGLEGDITQSHIHFGNKNASGGICVFLCQRGQANAPAGTPECPAGRTGMVAGEVDASDVIGPGPQGINAGEFDEVVQAIRAGRTYANVHSSLYPGGEIRAQLDD
jgi:CHRD domain